MGSAVQAVGVACAHTQMRQDRAPDSDRELRALFITIKNSFYRQEAVQGFKKSLTVLVLCFRKILKSDVEEKLGMENH